MNIDKDKKTLKEIVTELRTSFEECPHIIAIMHRFEKEDIQAISNEISELEDYKKNCIKKISKEKYEDKYFIEKAILSYKAQQEKTYTFFRDNSKEDLLTKYNWCQRPHSDNMSLHRFLLNGEIEAHMSESLAENFGLIQVDLNEFIFKFVQPIIKENVSIKSELETYKKIAEKLAEQLEKDYANCKCCKNLIRHFDMFECKEFTNKKQCIIDWARKEVEK